jgi:hypothetical protein
VRSLALMRAAIQEEFVALVDSDPNQTRRTMGSQFYSHIGRSTKHRQKLHRARDHQSGKHQRALSSRVPILA